MSEYTKVKPSKAQVTWTYMKRVWNWKRNSSPFLSGDLFSDNADISVFPPRYRGKFPTINQIKDAKVIFCPSDKLIDFFEEFRPYINARVVICGNSDKEFYELPENIENLPYWECAADGMHPGTCWNTFIAEKMYQLFMKIR